MIKILNEQKKPNKIYKVTCDECDCHFECDDTDCNVGVDGGSYVDCPMCGKQVYIDEIPVVLLTDANIEFPLHFYHFGEADGAVDISNEEIQKWVRQALHQTQDSATPVGYSYTGSGNTIVGVFLYDDEYKILVAKNYWECSIPRGQE